MTQLDTLPVMSQQVKQKTKIDPILSKVLQYTKRSWPSQTLKELEFYKNQHTELIIDGNCHLWSIQVIIPAKLQVPVFTNFTVVTLECQGLSLWHGATCDGAALTQGHRTDGPRMPAMSQHQALS